MTLPFSSSLSCTAVSVQVTAWMSFQKSSTCLPARVSSSSSDDGGGVALLANIVPAHTKAAAAKRPTMQLEAVTNVDENLVISLDLPAIKGPTAAHDVMPANEIVQVRGCEQGVVLIRECRDQTLPPPNHLDPKILADLAGQGNRGIAARGKRAIEPRVA